EMFHVGFGDLDAFLVDPRVECALDFEPGLGRCRRDELDDGGVVCERPAAPVLRDAAEQAVLDLVPFRARLNNWWVKMTACSPQVRFSGKFKWIFEQRNQLI